MSKKTKSLSEQLRAHIEAAEITRYRLSKNTGVTQASLSRFMSGHRGLQLSAVDAIAKELGLELIRPEKPNRKAQ
jgi:transcriptional regulator with XRE-family HTH domain